MDPDSVFIILLFLVLLILFIINLIGLSRKIYFSDIGATGKILLTIFFLLFIIIGFLNFDNVGTESTVISPLTVIMFIACALIGTNWSINIYRRLTARNRKVNPFILISVLSIAFGFIILLSFHGLGRLFENLDLMGSNY